MAGSAVRLKLRRYETMTHNAAQDIMIILKRKYNQIEQIYSYTLDMEKSASQNDSDTINMLLGMRYSIMTDIESLDEEISEKIQSLSDSDRIRVRAQMSENPMSSEVSFEEGKINEIWNSIRSVLKKIIESDEKLKLKIEALSKLSSMDSI